MASIHIKTLISNKLYFLYFLFFILRIVVTAGEYHLVEPLEHTIVNPTHDKHYRGINQGGDVRVLGSEVNAVEQHPHQRMNDKDAGGNDADEPDPLKPHHPGERDKENDGK